MQATANDRQGLTRRAVQSAVQPPAQGVGMQGSDEPQLRLGSMRSGHAHHRRSRRLDLFEHIRGLRVVDVHIMAVDQPWRPGEIEVLSDEQIDTNPD
jgi:hypothetical protein